jgi:hypothetical protein
MGHTRVRPGPTTGVLPSTSCCTKVEPAGRWKECSVGLSGFPTRGGAAMVDPGGSDSAPSEPPGNRVVTPGVCQLSYMDHRSIAWGLPAN